VYSVATALLRAQDAGPTVIVSPLLALIAISRPDRLRGQRGPGSSQSMFSSRCESARERGAQFNQAAKVSLRRYYGHPVRRNGDASRPTSNKRQIDMDEVIFNLVEMYKWLDGIITPEMLEKHRQIKNRQRE
jgi:superfamily II DNA helicase RecQ